MRQELSTLKVWVISNIFQAEIHAILTSSTSIEPIAVYHYADSQAAVKVQSSNEIHSKMVWRCQKTTKREKIQRLSLGPRDTME